jgi:hypothetical protein
LVKSYLIDSARIALNSDTGMSKATCLTMKNGTAANLDWTGYVNSVGRMKMTSAFDGTDLGTGENNPFGTATMRHQHFTAFGQSHDIARAPRPALHRGQS